MIEIEFEQYLPCLHVTTFLANIWALVFLLVGVNVHVSFHSSFPKAMPWDKMMTKLGFVVMHFGLRSWTGIIYTLEHNS
jgi:hypothetical protein